MGAIANKKMTYEQIKNLKEKEFKRLCGIKPQIFTEMVGILRRELPTLKKRGVPPKINTEDQLLIALELVCTILDWTLRSPDLCKRSIYARGL